MGCDIHTFAERINDEGQWECLTDFAPFDWRSYTLFGWLAHVRSYSVPAIAKGRDVPQDISQYVQDAYDDWEDDAHSHSWVSVAELLAFDYNALVHPGQPETYREFLGEDFFADLDKLKELDAKRVVFWFDN